MAEYVLLDKCIKKCKKCKTEFICLTEGIELCSLCFSDPDDKKPVYDFEAEDEE